MDVNLIQKENYFLERGFSELYLQERFLFHFSKASVFLLNKASLKDFICFCEENERAGEIILLLVSRDMMPLAISLAYRSSKIIIFDNGNIYSAAMGNLYKCSSNKKIITPREFEALKTTLLTKTRKLDWSCSIKTFYSQRHSALKKLNIDKLSSIF